MSLSELFGLKSSALFGILFVWTSWLDCRTMRGSWRLIGSLLQPHLEQDQPLRAVALAAGIPCRPPAGQKVLGLRRHFHFLSDGAVDFLPAGLFEGDCTPGCERAGQFVAGL